MDFRRIIAFGKSSHVVSLPRDWMEKNNLSKGDVVFITEELDKLVLTPKENDKEKELKKTIINLENKSLDRIKREIYSGYLNYSDYLIIRGKDLSKYYDEIFKTISNMMALEIIEQTNDEIVAQDFLRISDVNLKEKLRKCDITIRSMLTDLNEPDFEDYESIVVRQELVYRIYFVVLKIIKAVFTNPGMVKKTNFNYLELLGVYTKIFAFHNISRNLKLIAKTIQENKVNKKVFVKDFKKLEDTYLKILKVVNTPNIEKAFELSKLRDDGFKSLNESKLDPKISEKIKNIYYELHEILKREYS